MEALCLEKLVPISGDIGLKGLGMEEDVLARLRKEVNVIISCAASINFNEPLMTLMNINYFGPLQLLDLAKESENCSVFCHVSTAYVNSHKLHNFINMEDIVEKGDPDEIVQSILQKDPDYVQQNEKELISPWVNPYVFCKNLVERAIRKHRGDVKTIIVRPSIVTGCYREPMSGWTDSISAAGVIAYPMMLGLVRNFFVGPADICICPGDVCSNAVLVACAYADAIPNDDTTVITTCMSNLFRVPWTKFFASGSNHLAYNPTHSGL